jgi:hypothetical protein
MVRWNSLLSIVLSFALAPVPPPGWQAAVIDQDIWVPAPPLGHCVVPELAGHVFKATLSPGGVEYLPGRCGRHVPSRGERVSLRGLTAREALDRLVQLDARYRWVERDGVLIVRPVIAWDHPGHFLHRTVSLAFTDQNVGGALSALLTAIGPTKFPGERTFNTLQMNRRFSVSLNATSVLEAMNAVARTHGDLQWLVGYCQPQSKVEFASVMLHTFDDGGIGGQPVGTTVDENVQAYVPCNK